LSQKAFIFQKKGECIPGFFYQEPNPSMPALIAMIMPWDIQGKNLNSILF
jgi:hypothetical protein